MSARRAVPVWAVVSSSSAPLALIGGWTIAGGLRSDDYSPAGQTISALAARGAQDRWVMTLALAVVGVSHLVTSAGLRPARPAPRFVLGIAGLASLGVAVFPQPSHGSSTIHGICATVSIVALCGWPLLVGEAGRLRAAYSVGAALILIAALGWFATQLGDGAQLGSSERLVTGLQVFWPLVVVCALRWAPAKIGP